jgi:fibronectin type 3 domain-containing protein
MTKKNKEMKILLLIIAVIIGFHLSAQQTLPNLARPGAKGIFVLTGEKISDVKGPVTAYRIERKAGNEKDFSLVATLPAVASPADFKKNVERSESWLPFAQDLASLKIDSIWQKGKAGGTLSALRAIGYSLPVLAGFNMVWLDEKVAPGKTYEYRVTAVGDTYAATSFPVVYTSPVLAGLQFDRNQYNARQNHMQLYYTATGNNKPVFMELYRKENKGQFAKVPTSVSFLTKKDTVEYLVKDTTAQQGRLYNYYVKAYDALGNAAPVKDTLLIASLDYLQMPMPQQVKVVSDSSRHAINISWKLRSASLIKSLTLYRSTSSVKGFDTLAVLSPGDTTYADQQVQPATAYFYYFEAEYKTQDIPKRGIPFAGSFIDNTQPNAPQNIQASGTRDGVQLSWQSNSPQVSGFWLYRAERGRPMQLLTTMITALPGQADYTYTDTDSLLNGSRFYTYALKAFSTSHIESMYSDTVMARPLKNIPVPKPPMQISTTREEGLVLVYWDAVSKYDETVSGYKLLRKRNNTTDTIYCVNNLYKDTLVKAGDSVRYSVITMSMYDVQSVPAAWAVVKMPGVKPGSPASLAANPVQTGIQLTWELPNAGETLQYNVYRYERGQQAVKTGSVSGQEKFIDTSASRGKQYFYYVVAIGDNKIESNRSNEAVVKY